MMLWSFKKHLFDYGCSFLESKKNEKTFGVTQTPIPSALGGAGQGGQQKAIDKRVL